MTNVVSLDTYRPHMEGPAVCTHCKHEWEAVAPEGTYRNLECPACHTFHGVMLAGCEPDEGQQIFTCNCGCDVFMIQPDWTMCVNCGARAQPWTID